MHGTELAGRAVDHALAGKLSRKRQQLQYGAGEDIAALRRLVTENAVVEQADGASASPGACHAQQRRRTRTCRQRLSRFGIEDKARQVGEGDCFTDLAGSVEEGGAERTGAATAP